MDEKRRKIYAPIQVSSGFVIGESESALSKGTTRYSYKFSKTVPSLTVPWLSAITSTYRASTAERTGTIRVIRIPPIYSGENTAFHPSRTNYSWRNFWNLLGHLLKLFDSSMLFLQTLFGTDTVLDEFQRAKRFQQNAISECRLT